MEVTPDQATEPADQEDAQELPAWLIQLRWSASIGILEIRLRWFAALGVLGGTWLASSVLNVPLSTGPLYVIGGCMLVYNALLRLALERGILHSGRIGSSGVGHSVAVRRLWTGTEEEAAVAAARFDRLVKIQAGLDWLAMILLVHFSGGAESPLLFFFVFHLIVSSILLSRSACYALATLATVAVAGLGQLEFFGIVRHQTLWLTSGTLYRNEVYLAAVLLFFTITLYFTVYLATTVTQSLREKDQALLQAQQELSAAYAALEEADRAKSEFMRMASHELRSPLSAVQSMLRIMEQGIVGPLSDKQRDLIGRTSRRVSMLLAMVRDLLELAAGRMELLKQEEVQVDLGKLVARVTKLMTSHADEKEQDFQVAIGDGPLVLTGVEEDLEQVVMNLVSNAIKYTPTGGTVMVRAGQDTARIHLQVSDTGIGIPQDALPRIFSEFFRAKNAKAFAAEGTGLGLVISKEFVERHGGSISVESVLGQGSTFTVQLPRAGQRPLEGMGP